MTPEANDALHRVQALHPYVKWVEDDGDVILYREDSKAFVFLVMGGALVEEKALAELEALAAELAGVQAAPEPDPVVTVGKRAKAKPVEDAPEESPPEHVSEGDEAMIPASVVVNLLEQALEKRDEG